ncbi:glycosyltransferase family 2 protein [Fischerella thermalis]|uniref:glycosyltransferase family 2 protein n=1 Tax=Fischerella thermalis TaxID=372787 RepID=UPI000C8039A2|nr:glycosyltransferase [Fischerella thermalis]PLZ07084.1 glycosyl transferase family 2 [Fischerella thermalis WC114]PLZ11363.1 glycosyl transferase family 2 [Fischerella thermalis WC119]PLZ13295.1 glycosyl transferase family 2 [Fischerella thermalis WC1110]PLZ17384.1 glycosyl transferase family 2 [Fischerella thermalis WC157]PLZ23660.1 glycosyl transferase family 2 [Fischerella thermalis WC341]
MPKISICIPTFNRVKLLPFAIDSVLQQTYQDLELIICDDGSCDGTPKLISQYTDSRIRYIRHSQNIGKSNNMRAGFEAARGEYFIKFDDDDRLTPDFLARTASILDHDPSIDFVGTDHWIIDIDNTRDEVKTQENSRRWGRVNLSAGIVDNLLEVVFVQQSFQIGATLFRRQTLEELGFMQPNWQNCEDNDLFVRLALAGKKGYYLPELLMEYRVHAEQQGINRAIPYLQDKLRYLSSYTFESDKLEKVRLQRLAETQLLLGLRLIEKGEVQKGRELVFAGKSFSHAKAWAGLGLSLLPGGVREKAFEVLRQVRG